MLSTTAPYLSVSSNIARQQAATAARGDVKTATASYLANIGHAKTVAQFVGDDRLFSYAMTAYGLGDMAYAKGLMTKVLNGGITDAKALANTLSDPRYRAFAAAFDFAGQGATATAAASATTGVTARYVEQALEDDQAKTDPGVSDALYFTRSAASIESVYGLLADRTMLSVVETAYGLSSTLGQSDIDTQAAVLGKVVTVADLQDPAKVAKLVGRYTAQYDAARASAASNVLLLDTSDEGAALLDAADGVGGSVGADSVLNLFDSGSSAQGGIGSDLLLSLSKLRRGGT